MKFLNRTFFVASAAVVAAVLGLAGLLPPVRNGLRALTLPVIRSVSGTAGEVSSGESGADARVQELEARLNTLTVDYVQLKALEEENRSLRAQAKFLETSGYDSVGARVIGRDIRGPRALLLIDRGSIDNVEVGHAVVTDEGLFVGKISRIEERVATVEIFTDPTSRVAASLIDRKELSGVVEGRGNGAAALTYVPNNSGLERDQVVVTAGTEERIPANLPIGIVNTVEGKSTDPFLTASIEPLARLDGITFVSVLRPAALRPRL